jgi:mannose-1-phosphate guanylyltransferase
VLHAGLCLTSIKFSPKHLRKNSKTLRAIRDLVLNNKMRYSVIIAGGSGTRLWPMSRAGLPKQLIPFIKGKSLLQIAFDRLEGLIPESRRYICAGQKHEGTIFSALSALDKKNFLGEPLGRDTLNAVGLSAAILASRDPDAVFTVLTADHLIEPIDHFQKIIEQGFELVERVPQTLVTFGIAPTGPAIGYGYLELGRPLTGGARIVDQFKEKPPLSVAEEYFKKGPDHYLWNSGMFVWSAATMLDCIKRLEPDVYAGLMKIAKSWDKPDRQKVMDEIYPTLKKISIDFAVMEPASRMDGVNVAAIAMPLQWLDIGSWPSFAETCAHDESGNALAAEKIILKDSANCLAASDEPDHLVAMLGCQNLIVIHTKNATLICPADRAQDIKNMCNLAEKQFPGRYT